MEIGAFVRDRRKALNLTQQQLADKAGVGLNFVYQLEKNKPTVQMDCTRQVLEALGYEFDVKPRSTNRSEFFSPIKSHPRPKSPWDE